MEEIDVICKSFFFFLEAEMHYHENIRILTNYSPEQGRADLSASKAAVQ